MITGVGLLLFTQEWNPRMFVVEELNAKPQYRKEKGMVSFPIETHEAADGSIEGTIQRLIVEEVGIDPSEVVLCGIEPRAFRLIPGREDVESRYGFGVLRGSPSRQFQPRDPDIRFVGWRTAEELLVCHVRIETAPIVEHFRIKHLRAFMQRISGMV